MQIGILNKNGAIVMKIAFVMLFMVILSWLSFNVDSTEPVDAMIIPKDKPAADCSSLAILAEPQGLTCNQNLQISLDYGCEAVISPYMMLSNTLLLRKDPLNCLLQTGDLYYSSLRNFN